MPVDKPDWMLRLARPTIASPLKWRLPRLTSLTWGFRGNGFRDEVVELRVLRGGVLIFSNRLQFSRNLVNDITFETDIRGTAAPELRAGDVVRVTVNGRFTLRGRFQLHLILVTFNPR
jgi:hypothetical protein